MVCSFCFQAHDPHIFPWFIHVFVNRNYNYIKQNTGRFLESQLCSSWIVQKVHKAKISWSWVPNNKLVWSFFVQWNETNTVRICTKLRHYYDLNINWWLISLSFASSWLKDSKKEYWTWCISPFWYCSGGADVSF